MPNLSYAVSDFVAFTRIKSADVNSRFDDIKTLLNTTKLDSTNVQTNGLTRDRLAQDTHSTATADAVVVNDTNGNMVSAKASGLKLASPKIADYETFVNTTDPSTPSSGEVALYAKGSRFYLKDDTGGVSAVGSGGAAGINYISNPDAEVGLTGWTLYNESVTATISIATPAVITIASTTGVLVGSRVSFSTTGALPTGLSTATTYYVSAVPSGTTFRVAATKGGADIATSGTQSGVHTASPYDPIAGTGGTGSGLAFTRSTSSPLRSTASFLLAQTAGIAQGEGVSYPFTIDAADKAKVLGISFNYNASSVFGASSGVTGSDSDLEVYVYDVTNAILVPVSPSVIVGKGSLNFAFNGTFQTSSNSTSYRLIFHVGSANANTASWAFKWDNVVVGPQVASLGYPGTDSVACTPVFTGFGTVTGISAYSRRSGDCLEQWGYFTAGTVSATEARISLCFNGGQSNVSTDSAKIASGTVVGYAAANSAAATFFHIAALAAAGSGYVTFGAQTSTTSEITPGTGAGVFTSAQPTSFYIKVPISGWASTAVMSSDTDTRVVSLSAVKTGGGVTASTAIPTWTTVNKDSHGAFNATTGVYTVPVAGDYFVSGVFSATAATASSLLILKNAATIATGTFAASDVGITVNALVSGCVVGDTLAIASGVTLTTSSGTSYGTMLSINRLSGPATIASSESVNASAYLATSAAVSANTPIIFDAKNYDTHNAYSTVTGIFTCPMAGKYRLTARAVTASGTPLVYATKNASNAGYIFVATTALNSGSITLSCVTGDTLAIVTDTSLSFTGAAPGSTGFDIERVGN